MQAGTGNLNSALEQVQLRKLEEEGDAHSYELLEEELEGEGGERRATSESVGPRIVRREVQARVLHRVDGVRQDVDEARC